MKKFMVPADDLLHLIDERDAWAGALHPDDRDDYLDRFADLRRKVEKYLGVRPTEENPSD